MSHQDPITSVQRDQLTFFYDTRSRSLPNIMEFLTSEKVELLQKSISGKAYIVLGGDGLFVAIAKQAHKDQTQILGINFGTKGYLLHDRSVFESDALEFETRAYPILHVDAQIGEEHVHGYAFNEVYITRAGDASVITLSMTHKSKTIKNYRADGLMISTSAGSTGWSKSYGGVILPHGTNLNAITPIGKVSPNDFQAMVLPDKGRIRIKNDVTRTNPIDILLDNRRMVTMESGPMDILIERAHLGVKLLIEKSYKTRWENKPYGEVGFTSL